MFQLFVVVPGSDCKRFSEFLSLYKDDLEYRVPPVPSNCSDVMYSIRVSSYTEDNGYEIDECIEELIAYVMLRRWKYEIIYN